MPVADILQGLFSGLGGGLGHIEQQRRQNTQLQLQQRQFEAQQRKQMLDEFLTRVDAVPLDAGVDPEMAKEGATLGLSSLFMKGPDGQLRKSPSLSEQLTKLRLDTENLTNQRARFQLTRDQEKLNPTAYAKLMKIADPYIRDFMAKQQFGIDAPTTEAEIRKQRQMEADTSPGVASARIYAGAGAGRRSRASGQDAITPNILNMLTKTRQAAEQDPTDRSGILGGFTPGFLGGEVKPSANALAYVQAAQSALSRFDPAVVADARNLARQFPGVPTGQLMQAATQLPGFDPNTDGPLLEQVLDLVTSVERFKRGQ